MKVSKIYGVKIVGNFKFITLKKPNCRDSEATGKTLLKLVSCFFMVFSFSQASIFFLPIFCIHFFFPPLFLVFIYICFTIFFCTMKDTDELQIKKLLLLIRIHNI